MSQEKPRIKCMEYPSLLNIYRESQILKVNTKEWFTWSSGIKSPIYLDHRQLFANYHHYHAIVEAFCQFLETNFPEVEQIVGVATGGIAWAALVATKLNKGFAYVRSSIKTHGQQQEIEGFILPTTKVVVIEDVLSSGKSALRVVKILRDKKINVLSVGAVFSYQLNILQTSYQLSNVNYFSLVKFEDLKVLFTNEQQQIMQEFFIKLNHAQPNNN